MIFLWLISWLPYRLQLIMGKGLGKLLAKIGAKRGKVALRNLELCFPELSDDERNEMLRKNFESTGIALLETGMGWWWPDWRVKPKVSFSGLEHVDNALKEGKGVLLLGVHYLNIEFCCRAIGLHHPLVVFYRPHNNALMEYFQYRGRGRSNKYMLGKKDVKGLIGALRDKETCVYLPDQDYGRKRSMFLPFFNVKETATTTGTLIFTKQPNVASFVIYTTRNTDGSGYRVTISPQLDNFPSGDDEADLIRVNKEVEQAVRQQPEQYLWMHRRFKTRPNESDASLYD